MYFQNDPLPNKGKNIDLPSFDDLWYAYPNKRKVSRDGYQNQCAMRLSKSLFELGVSNFNYEKYGGSDPYTSEGFIRGSKPMADWIWGEFGRPEIITNVDNFKTQFAGVSGIIFFLRSSSSQSWNHIDIWNGNDTKTGFYYSNQGVVEIWFWELK